MSNQYQPPFSITPAILHNVVEIGELIGQYAAIADANMTPQLRRGNRIRTIQASLAIENNTMTVEQVTAILDGKKVLGLPREIQEVHNAFAAYEQLDKWIPSFQKDLLAAHKLLTKRLIDTSGLYRTGGVGVVSGTDVIHMAPPAERVHSLMNDLFNWLKNTKEHPLISSCVFHYELEFIHPFDDGNGRIGRLWQTLILSKWEPIWLYLPVETLIKEHQQDYYKSLGESNARGESTPFIEFMIEILRNAVFQNISTDQVSVQVTDQVKALLPLLKERAASTSELLDGLGLSHRPTFRKNYLEPALSEELIERTEPDSPSSPTQKYRLTDKGREMLQDLKY